MNIVMMIADAYLPVSLSVPGITDAQFQEFCEQYADYRLEYTAEGDLLIMPPTDPETGARNAIIIEELSRWSRADGRGIVTDSSAGFILPNEARLSPDAVWTSRERFRQSPRMFPEFVIELLSASDRLSKAQDKMLEWIDNGAQLAWLINPRNQTVTVYRPTRPSEIHAKDVIEGEGPIAGFTLDLRTIWAV